jgi:gluconate 2-dehydrogenase gamma chain
MDRRTSLKLLALSPLPLAAGCTWSPDDVDHAHRQADAARASGGPPAAFFTAHEGATVRVLADLIFPADDRSGSATDLGVPEFMNFIVADVEGLQIPIRGGLAWLDAHTRRRFGHPFVEATDAERRSVLDEIAYPEDAATEVRHGAVFFTRFRDLAASGFWTTREGMEDLRYLGNRAVARWGGAPPSEMDRLGLTFDDWEVA